MSNEAAADGGSRRRRRRRATRAQGAPVAAGPAPVPPSDAPEPPAAKSPRKRRTGQDTGSDRGLRDLVGAGRSQLGVSGALRARDVNRPTEQDLAEAERDTVVVRRNWKPPAGS